MNKAGSGNGEKWTEQAFILELKTIGSMMDLLEVGMQVSVDGEGAESNLISRFFYLSIWVFMVPYGKIWKQGRKD